MYKKEMVSGFDIELNKRDILFHETQLKNYQTYIQSFIPKYNYYTCSCCGQPKRINKYYYNHSISNLGKIDGYGLQRSNMCIECSKKLFEFYFAKVHKKDSKKSMLNYCADTNTYWNEKVFNDTVKLIQSSQDSKHILDIYNEKLFSNHYGKTFFDSVLENDFGKSKSSKSKAADESLQSETQDTASAAIESTFAGFGGNTEQMDKFVDFNGEVVYWPKEDVKNLKKVIKMIGYDPFYYIDDEGARKNLYADFLNILDTDMQFDFTKMQAAIQIVTGFWKIREFDKMYAKLRAENASTSELKNISDLKTKEMQTITKFTQDHGFAERYAASKAKGEGTLTGIMEKMNES